MRRERGVELVEWGAALLLVAVVVGVVVAGVPGVVRVRLEAAICRVFDPQCAAGPDAQAGTAAPAPEPGGNGGSAECRNAVAGPICAIEGGAGNEGEPAEPRGGEGPATAAGLSPEIENAVNQAMSALERKDGDCNKLVTRSGSKFTAQQILYTLKGNGHILDKTSENAPDHRPSFPVVATTDFEQGSSGYMKLWKPFKEPRLYVPYRGELKPSFLTLLKYKGKPLSEYPNWKDIFRTVTILHEVAHTTGNWDDIGWTPEQYADNYNQIIEKCL